MSDDVLRSTNAITSGAQYRGVVGGAVNVVLLSQPDQSSDVPKSVK